MKTFSGNLTAGMSSGNFKQTVQSMISSDQCFMFMSCIKGTPAYWKKFQSEVLAMITQLGCPNFFLTLSCADLQWNELLSIIGKMNGNELSEQDIEHMTYFQRCDLLNKNPVFMSRNFQFRVEAFFLELLIKGKILGDFVTPLTFIQLFGY